MRHYGTSLWLVACVLFLLYLVCEGTQRDKRNNQETSVAGLSKDLASRGGEKNFNLEKSHARSRTHKDKLKRRKRKKLRNAPKEKSPRKRRRQAERPENATAIEESKVEAKLVTTPATGNPDDRRNSPAIPNWVPVLGKRACGKCLWQECQPVDVMKRHCPSGVIRDQCNCCVVCASGSRMPCYLTSFTPIWLPMCGDDLECVPVVGKGELDVHIEPGSWGARRELEGECSCIERTPVCGSNNQTYDNICEFRELSARWSLTQGETVTVSHPGPCNSAPKLDRGPEDTIARIGDVVFFRCETSGFPLPRIQWFKQKGPRHDEFDGVNVNASSPVIELPGYLNHAVTQMRGGPGKYQITTWLTLDNVGRTDEGVYFCRMTNADGEVDGLASLKVTAA